MVSVTQKLHPRQAESFAWVDLPRPFRGVHLGAAVVGRTARVRINGVTYMLIEMAGRPDAAFCRCIDLMATATRYRMVTQHRVQVDAEDGMVCDCPEDVTGDCVHARALRALYGQLGAAAPAA